MAATRVLCLVVRLQGDLLDTRLADLPRSLDRTDRVVVWCPNPVVSGREYLSLGRDVVRRTIRPMEDGRGLDGVNGDVRITDELAIPEVDAVGMNGLVCGSRREILQITAVPGFDRFRWPVEGHVGRHREPAEEL
ncbi:hypothetical protein [Haloarchaeobius salinus]|uniref:hypothetical protein n=1 Tax=Haloarchaeobius salinus TaxID=1198298 RepID=UPI00210F1B65|nr:hypothetical protein [Haloarchaeobius salinus]